MDYEKQGQDFLTKYNVKMRAVFVKYGLHFDDDNSSRDVFRIVFSRDKQNFSLSFGPSIAQSTGAGDNLPRAYDVLACLTKYEPGSF